MTPPIFPKDELEALRAQLIDEFEDHEGVEVLRSAITAYEASQRENEQLRASRCANCTGGGRYQCALLVGHVGKHRAHDVFLEWSDDMTEDRWSPLALNEGRVKVLEAENAALRADLTVAQSRAEEAERKLDEVRAWWKDEEGALTFASQDRINTILGLTRSACLSPDECEWTSKGWCPRCEPIAHREET